MANAQGSSFQFCYVEEVTWGTTPSTPSMKKLPVSNVNIAMSKSSLEDNTLRGDRMRTDVRHGMKTIGGSVEGNLRYGDFDDWIEAALFGAWSTNVLKAASTETYFSGEKGFTDIAQYGVYAGLMITKMSVSIKPDAMIPITFEVIGKSASWSGTAQDGTPDAYSSNKPFDSFTGSLTEGGSAIAIVTGLDFTLDNGLVGSPVVGSSSIVDIVAGRSKVSGTLTAYFTSLTLLNKFINETASAIVVTLTDLSSNSLEIKIPNVKYMGGDPQVTSEGPVEISMPFEGLYDSVTGTCLQITRTPHA